MEISNMSTPEVVLGAIAAVGAVVSAVFGGGLLTRYVKHSGELAVTKHILEETQVKLAHVIDQVADLKNNSVEINTKMELFTEHIRKLDMIPNLVARLAAVDTIVVSVQSIVTTLLQDRVKHS